MQQLTDMFIFDNSFFSFKITKKQQHIHVFKQGSSLYIMNYVLIQYLFLLLFLVFKDRYLLCLKST